MTGLKYYPTLVLSIIYILLYNRWSFHNYLRKLILFHSCMTLNDHIRLAKIERWTVCSNESISFVPLKNNLLLFRVLHRLLSKYC